MKTQDLKGKSNLWIFGYGSLVWKPGFDYRRSKVGHITGYKRRLWHGDVFYRGDKNKVTPACPGHSTLQSINKYTWNYIILFYTYIVSVSLPSPSKV